MKEVKVEITDRDEIIKRNVLALGYSKNCQIRYDGMTCGRVTVFADDEYIGIWDDVKRTFID